MIVNNIVQLADTAFKITSADKETTEVTLPINRYIELDGAALKGAPPYTVYARGGCGSACLAGVGADDVVTYYQGYNPSEGKGENRLSSSADIR